MAVSIEIKGNLARLLATENLIIEHKQVETASFDVVRRVLTLPQWERASETVYDMLVAHEVGHALYTPTRNWIVEKEYFRVPPDYVNVVEDARIEKLMKRRFRGLNRDFHSGYQELNDQDFFCISEEDLTKLKPIDKINLYFKIGAFIDIEFTDEENEFLTRISNAETFDEVLDISKDIQTYTKERAQEQKQQQQQQQQNNTEQDGQETEQQTQQQSPGEGENESDVDEDTENPTAGAQDDPGIDWEDESSDTQRAFDDSQQSLNNPGGSETNYVELPEVDLKRTVIPFDDIFEHLSEHYNAEDVLERHFQGREWIAAKYTEFKRDAAKEVNYLVKEFEMKKSADAYARATTSRTGVLNTSKLHTYKYNEDLFKKVTTIPDGKNHGLVFLLDWSGSMSNIMEDTMKQLFQLVWFCRKVNIPFEVYAFTNDSWRLSKPEAGHYYDVHTDPMVKEWRDGDITIDGSFRMVNILSSKVKTKQTDEMMRYLYIAAVSFGGYGVSYPPMFTLSGTPLNEAIIASKEIVKQMMKNERLQKCHVICLTDGEGYSPSYNRERKYHHSGEVSRGRARLGYNSMLRNRNSGRMWKVSEYDFTNTCVECVKSELPGVSYIGFRVLGRGDIRSFTSYFGNGTSSDELQSTIRKKGSVCMRLDSFDMMFGIPQAGLNADSDLNVDNSAKKADVSKAFRKMFKNKKTNKFVLQQFANQIA